MRTRRPPDGPRRIRLDQIGLQASPPRDGECRSVAATPVSTRLPIIARTSHGSHFEKRFEDSSLGQKQRRGTVNRAHPREHEGSYAHMYITASMFSVRLCSVHVRQRVFSPHRSGSGSQRLNIISIAHGQPPPVGARDPTELNDSVRSAARRVLSAPTLTQRGFSGPSCTVARTAAVQHLRSSVSAAAAR